MQEDVHVALVSGLNACQYKDPSDLVMLAEYLTGHLGWRQEAISRLIIAGNAFGTGQKVHPKYC
jgi:hypothetical protein